MRSFARLVGLLVALAALAASGGVAAAESRLEVVARGLDNPRGLDVGRWGTVYVTEAGKGGSGPCIEGPEGPVCLGATGAVTQIAGGKQRRILTGLPSLAAADGSGASGPQDIALRRYGGGASLAVGGIAAPQRAQLGAGGAGLSTLYRVSPDLRLRVVADLAAYEAAANPDGDQPSSDLESNPNSVLSAKQGDYVVDAGGNDLLRVGPKGRVSLVAVFPFRFVDAPPFLGLPAGTKVPLQPVPTSVAAGPDGALYVGQLTGFPFPVGAANVYRVKPGSAPEVYASGFTNITDIAFGPDGSLYVLEFAKGGILAGPPAGALTRVRPDGARETIVSEGLVGPTGLAIGRKGAIYISNNGSAAGIGEVVRVRR